MLLNHYIPIVENGEIETIVSFQNVELRDVSGHQIVLKCCHFLIHRSFNVGSGLLSVKQVFPLPHFGSANACDGMNHTGIPNEFLRSSSRWSNLSARCCFMASSSWWRPQTLDSSAQM